MGPDTGVSLAAKRQHRQRSAFRKALVGDSWCGLRNLHIGYDRSLRIINLSMFDAETGSGSGLRAIGHQNQAGIQFLQLILATISQLHTIADFN